MDVQNIEYRIFLELKFDLSTEIENESSQHVCCKVVGLNFLFSDVKVIFFHLSQ